MNRWIHPVRAIDCEPGLVFAVGVHFADPAKVIWLRGGGSILTSPDYIITEASIVRVTELEAPADDEELGTDSVVLFPVDPDHPYLTLRITLKVGDDQFTTHVRPDHHIYPLPSHYERCGSCGELWPCREDRIDSAARRFAMDLDDVCAHCGKKINGAWSQSFGGRKWHIAKKYRHAGVLCRDAAAEALAEHRREIAAEATR